MLLFEICFEGCKVCSWQVGTRPPFYAWQILQVENSKIPSDLKQEDVSGRGRCAEKLVAAADISVWNLLSPQQFMSWHTVHRNTPQ